MSNFSVREEFVRKEAVAKEETVVEELSKEQSEHHIMLEKVRSKCHTCKNWAYKLKNVVECRLYPPRFDGINTGTFPMVYFQDWCGQHAPTL
jgi:hypothetical protein